MTKPESILANQRAKVADLDARAAEAVQAAERERAVLQGMETIADAMGDTAKRPVRLVRSFSDLTEKKVGGRQPGSISVRWRIVLTALLTHFEWFDADEVIKAVRHYEGRTMKPSEVKRLFSGYIEYGFLEQNDAGDYRVTDLAISKFGLEPKVNSTPQAQAPNVSEAPNGEAAGASEGAPVSAENTGWGVGPYSSRPQGAGESE